MLLSFSVMKCTGISIPCLSKYEKKILSSHPASAEQM